MLGAGMGLKILLVDDETHILRLLTRVLTHAGHDVCAFENGDEARQYLVEGVDELDVILLDMVIPPRDGLDVLDDALARRPGIPFVLMSGDEIEPSLRQRIETMNGSFLGKPFHPDAVLRAIAAVISRSQQGD